MAKKAYIGLNKTFTVTNLLDFNTIAESRGEYWGSRVLTSETRYTGWAKFLAPPGNTKCGFFYNNISTGVGEATYSLTYGTLRTFALNNTHKYYFSIMLYQDNDNPSGSFDAYWPIQEPPVISKFKLSKGRSWERASSIFVKTGVPNGNYPFRIDYNEPKNGYGMRFGNIVLVDLTATFGAGGEPDKAWCDANLNFHDGASDKAADTATIKVTRSVARKIKKIYMGGQHTFGNEFFNGNTQEVVYQLVWSNSTGRQPWTQDASWLKDSPYSMVMYNESGSPAEIMRYIGGEKRSLVKGHKYYFRCWLLQPEKNGSFDMYWPEAEPSVIAGATVTGNNEWTRVSTVVDRNSFSTGSYHVRFDYNSPGVNKRMIVNGVMLVDLTAAFGAGNEPDKSWCDDHIPYVGTATGTVQNVAEPVTKSYIGIDSKARSTFYS